MRGRCDLRRTGTAFSCRIRQSPIFIHLAFLRPAFSGPAISCHAFSARRKIGEYAGFKTFVLIFRYFSPRVRETYIVLAANVTNQKSSMSFIDNFHNLACPQLAKLCNTQLSDQSKF